MYKIVPGSKTGLGSVAVAVLPAAAVVIVAADATAAVVATL